MRDGFWGKIDFPTEGKITDCWIWMGCKQPRGYGQLKFNNKSYNAHRFSYQLFKGKIPEGLQIDHLCKNKSCVNPDHLEAVTASENIRRTNPVLTNAASKKTRELFKNSKYMKEDIIDIEYPKMYD